MATHLEENDLSNTQQMEVAVNGPDGATHLILCTGIANLRAGSQATYTFRVGPPLTRRQFVAVTAWGAISRVQVGEWEEAVISPEIKQEAGLVTIFGEYDDESGQVRISAEVTPGSSWAELGISYHVSILAELASH